MGEEEDAEASFLRDAFTPKLGSRALSFVAALAVPRGAALLDLGKRKLLLLRDFLSREGDESSIGAFWNWGSDVCTTVPSYWAVTSYSIRDAVVETDRVSRAAASFSKADADNSDLCSRSLLSEAATHAACEVAMGNSEAYSSGLAQVESQTAASPSEETIQDSNVSNDSLVELESQSLASPSNAMDNDSNVCSIALKSMVAASISEGAILNSEVCSSDVSESAFKFVTLPSDLVICISEVASCDLTESVSDSRAPTSDASTENSGRKKKVRFSPDVVEPSGDNREYRRRMTAALIMGMKMATDESPSPKEHRGMTQNLGSFFTRDANHSEIASNLLDLAGKNSFRTHHQPRMQSFPLSEVEVFSNPKSPSDENWTEIAVCDAGHKKPNDSQTHRHCRVSTDLKLASDEIYTEIALKPPAADTGYNEKINSSPQSTHQWRVKAFATPRLPLNRMAMYNVVHHYSS